MMKDERFEVTLGTYKGLHYKQEDITVTDAEVEDALERERRQGGALVTVGKAAEKGDTVVIDYAGFCEGKQFQGGTSREPYPLVLGSGSFIPGFEEQLIGARAGDERDVNVTFPAVYHEPSLAGKPAVFHCKVHAVQQKQTPAFGDEFAKGYGCADMAELREKMKANLTEQKRSQAADRALNELLGVILANSTVKLSDAFLKENQEQMFKYFVNSLQQQGANLQMYAQYTGYSEEELKAQIYAQAVGNANSIAILSAIAEEEQIEVTDAEVDAELGRMAQAYGMNKEQLKALTADKELTDLRSGIRTTKAMTFIMDHAVAD